MYEDLTKELGCIMEAAPESRAIKPAFIEARNVEDPACTMLMTPIEPDTHHEDSDDGILVHKGLLSGNGFNNLENLKRYGIFGRSPVCHPTYLMKINSPVATYGREGVKIVLWVDKKEYRLVM